MNTLIVYDSSYGNTERVACAIAKALSQHGEARVVSAAEIDSLSKEGLDLLVVGALTQRHGLPTQVKALPTACLWERIWQREPAPIETPTFAGGDLSALTTQLTMSSGTY